MLFDYGVGGVGIKMCIYNIICVKYDFNNIKQKDFDVRHPYLLDSQALSSLIYCLLSCLKYNLEVGVNKLESHNNDSPDMK